MAATDEVAGTGRAHEARAVALPERVTSYPTLNVALYHAGAAAGRVWYLARAIDEAGRGVVAVDELRALLTDKASGWRVYSWRRLRQVLAQGEELGLWQRDELGNLWLRAPHRVAEALGCGLLRGRPVYLDINRTGLLGSHKYLNANLYASWESGRAEPSPISRATLEEKTGVPARRQREYDALLGRESTSNLLITDELYTPANRQEAAWQHGDNVLCFTDWLGKRGGDSGAEYIARRLPSTRDRCHELAPKGRLRKHNRRIDLVNIPAPGNKADVTRVYHLDGAAAAAAFNRAPEHVHYYPEGQTLRPTVATRARLAGVQLWGQVCLA